MLLSFVGVHESNTSSSSRERHVRLSFTCVSQYWWCIVIIVFDACIWFHKPAAANDAILVIMDDDVFHNIEWLFLGIAWWKVFHLDWSMVLFSPPRHTLSLSSSMYNGPSLLFTQTICVLVCKCVWFLDYCRRGRRKKKNEKLQYVEARVPKYEGYVA